MKLHFSKKALLIFTISLAFLTIAIFPFGENKPIKYIERHTNKLKTEKVAGEFWLKWLYNNPIGELSLYALVKRKLISDFYGNRMNSANSKTKIAKFISDFNIEMHKFENTDYKSFNDFFTRKYKPEFIKIDTNSNVLISPADSKVLAYKNIQNTNFIVKGAKFNLSEFLQNDSLANVYKDGSLFIFRLCPADYHRFHFPFSGTTLKNTKINGFYYSVSPIALRKNVEIYCENKREYTIFKTQYFDNVIMAEVGATLVGSIINTHKSKKLLKGEEKGFFKFGGSTIILILKKGTIKIDNDLINNTLNNLETEIKFGEQIALKYH